MTAQRETCPARIELSNAQVAWLEARPFGGHMVPARRYCALEVGHPGPHAALGQQGDGVEWWVCWSLSASEIVETTICPAVRDEPDDYGEDVVCLLHVHHPGRHSFELRSTG